MYRDLCLRWRVYTIVAILAKGVANLQEREGLQ